MGVFAVMAVLLFTASAPIESTIFATTSIDATIGWFCGLSSNFFCVEMKIYELDPISSNDLLAKRSMCIKPQGLKWNQTAKFDRIFPGGDDSLHYEILPVITHNCTTDGKDRCIKPPRAFDVRAMPAQQFNYYTALDNNGYEGRCT